MKHIELFESFSDSYKAIVVFMENQIAAGVFPSTEAEIIYSELEKNIPTDSKHYLNVEMIDLPPNHNYIEAGYGGTDLSTSGLDIDDIAYLKGRSVLSRFGLIEEPYSIVQLGKDYDYSEMEKKGRITFKADKNLNGFVLVDSAGGTHFQTPQEIVNMLY
jgi:hypothetical protein